MSKLSLPSQRAVTASLSVNRLVAGRFEKFGSVKQYSDIIEANKSDVAVTAARLGRAAMLQKNVPQAALKDISAVLGNAGAAPEYHHMAAALRMKLNNQLLEVAEAQLVASGGDAEEGVADLRKAIQTDLATIAKNRPDCLLVKMFKAESLLMEAKYDEALPLLKEITDEAPVTPSSATSSDAAASLAGPGVGALLALHKDSGNEMKDAPKELMDALKETVKLPQATTEDLLALSEVLRAVATSHVYVDFFAPNEEYSTRYDGNIGALFCESNFSEAMAVYQGPRYHTGELPVLTRDDITPAMGSGRVIERIGGLFPNRRKERKCPVRDMCATFDEQRQARRGLFKDAATLEALVAELKAFLKERARLDAVLVLEQQHKLADAKALVDNCRGAPSWKKLMLSGRIKRACGALAEADKDFTELFKLRKKHAGFDVPPVDMFRTRSVF